MSILKISSTQMQHNMEIGGTETKMIGVILPYYGSKGNNKWTKK